MTFSQQHSRERCTRAHPASPCFLPSTPSSPVSRQVAGTYMAPPGLPRRVQVMATTQRSCVGVPTAGIVQADPSFYKPRTCAKLTLCGWLHRPSSRLCNAQQPTRWNSCFSRLFETIQEKSLQDIQVHILMCQHSASLLRSAHILQSRTQEVHLICKGEKIKLTCRTSCYFTSSRRR